MTRGWTQVSCTARRILNHWTTREASGCCIERDSEASSRHTGEKSQWLSDVYCGCGRRASMPIIHEPSLAQMFLTTSPLTPHLQSLACIILSSANSQEYSLSPSYTFHGSLFLTYRSLVSLAWCSGTSLSGFTFPSFSSVIALHPFTNHPTFQPLWTSQRDSRSMKYPFTCISSLSFML